MQRRYLRAVALAIGVGVLALPFLREHLAARSADDARSRHHDAELRRGEAMSPPRPAPATDSVFAAPPRAHPASNARSNARHELARPVSGGSAPDPASGGATHVADPRAPTSRSRLMTELDLYPQDQAFVTD